ncbi:hypothetical protein [Pontibacter arcticus]|uniref:DUF4369 domain-containing protein n=1 Tax=Pontibacter arcticus TaxID=2080288 RepID=A0A364RDV0_9BACT|nr:hypothetical protein [Pontibacter arcticus]RAU82437.1 hypothetical protein DP923_11675 [Pontibacter arcticus]
MDINRRWKLLGMCLMLLLTCSIYKTSAQARTEIDVQEWAEGTVFLLSGDTVKGPVTFYRTQEVLNVHHADGSMSTYTPVTVSHFILKSMPEGFQYTFVSLPWDLGKPNSDFKKPTFFEQLNNGPVTLVMRENYVKRDMNNYYSGRYAYYHPNYYGLPNNMWMDEVRELYYALLPDGDILELRNLRKDLQELFGKKAGQVKAFAKKNNLQYDRPNEVVRIVNYFNSLHSKGHVASE